MAVTHGAATRTAIADLVVDRVDVSGPGDIRFLDGATVLAVGDLANPAFGAASGPTATANSIASLTVDASGTPDSFEVRDGTGAVVFEGSVTATGGGGDATFDSVTWVQGGTVDVDSMTYTAPV